MKRYVLGIMCMLFCMQVMKAQDTETGYPEWVRQMQSPEGNLRKALESFEKQRKAGYKERGSGWKKFARWYYYYAPRMDKNGQIPSSLDKLQAYRRYKAGYNKKRGGNWQALGPKHLPDMATYQPNGMGRLNAIAFHPQDSSVIYVGAPSGGLWQTTDGGLTWQSFTDQLPTLGVSSILVHPEHPDTLYMGTGDRDAGDAPGVGVMKSVDAGRNWQLANQGMGEVTVGMMRMHPQDASVIIAATSGGIYKTTNGGNSWYLTSENLHFRDLEMHPGNPDIVYATAQGGFFRSVNNGETWEKTNNGLEPNDRLVIGVSADAPDRVYCLLSDYEDAFVGLYKSENAGLHFTKMSSTPNILGYNTDGTDGANQAFYDLCIAIDPDNADVIYSGGINVWKSEDAGNSWNIVTHWYGADGYPAVHADQHALLFSPVDGNLYSGNDGGIYYTRNGGESWTDISSGLAISQAYKMGQSSTSSNLIINGYQDNGTARKNAGGWKTIIGGDGMECVIDYSDDNYQYGTVYYGKIYRTTTGGDDLAAIAGKDVNGITESGGWVTPYALDPEKPHIMYAGYKNVWRSKNVKNAYSSTIQWALVSDFEGDEKIDVLAQSSANRNLCYVSRNRQLLRTTNLGAQKPDWTDLTENLDLPYGRNYITAIEPHPYDETVVYLTAGKQIYKSTNRGEDWDNITGSLPEVYFNTLMYDRYSHGGIYLGTTIGVFYRNDSMNHWQAFSSGLPVVDVRELEIYYNTGDYEQSRLRAATYGRGAWESPLHESSGLPPEARFTVEDTAVFIGEDIQLTNNSLLEPTDYYWTITPANYTLLQGSSRISENPYLRLTAPGMYSIALEVSNNLGSSQTVREDYLVVTDSIPMNTQSLTLCNARLYDDGGASSNYSNNRESVLRLFPPEDSLRMQLVFTEFELEATDQCNADYLEIYSGTDTSGEADGRYCATEIPDTVRSIDQSGALTLRFVSNDQLTAPGWSARAACVPFSLHADFESDMQAACTGDTVVFSPDVLGQPDFYQWEFGSGASPEAAVGQGPHKVVYQTAGSKSCRLTIVDSLADGGIETRTREYQDFINVNESPVAAFAYDTSELSVSFINQSTHASGYLWHFGDGNTSQHHEPTHQYENEGIYEVRLEASNAACGESEMTQSVEVTRPAGIPKSQTDKEVIIAPNPTSSGFFVENCTQKQIKRIVISGVLGNVLMEHVLSNRYPNKRIAFQVAHFLPGIYQVEVIFADDTKISRKLLVK